MAIFRNLSKNHLYCVDMNNLMKLCKDSDEREALFNAIAEMEQKGGAKYTLETKVRTITFETALINAGLSKETVESVMGECNLSGIIADKGTQMAEAYLNENLSVGCYVDKSKVNDVIKQFNENVKGEMSEKDVRSNFEVSMKELCDNAKKFDAKELAEMQIIAGKNGKSYEIYRNDKHEGLCITNVPKATIAANKEQIVADLKEKVKKDALSASKGASGFASGAKRFANGDAENLFKGSLQMTLSGMQFIFSKLMEYERNKELQRAIKQGEVDVNDTIKKLVSLEKQEMTSGIEANKNGVDAGEFEEVAQENLEDLDEMGLLE